MRKRKDLFMLIKVSVPRDMPAAQARREVRELITNQCNYSAEPGDVKCRRVYYSLSMDGMQRRPGWRSMR